jgi:2-methylcitrate dehydratase PrpD
VLDARPEHVEKAFDFGGMPARNGVTAAAMAAHGLSGVEDVFSASAASSSPIPARPQALVRGLGETFEILNASIKRWSVGSPIQAPLDSLVELMKRTAFQWGM